VSVLRQISAFDACSLPGMSRAEDAREHAHAPDISGTVQK
jgi:hypothetical protein